MPRFHHSLVMMIAAPIAVLSMGVSSPALAEVAEAQEDHFITRAQAVVNASRKETWLALISPSGWWSGDHTWSGDAANLKLTPQAGGCFCETIPETETPDGFTLQGSVEHMRVIQAYPEAALRMAGGLGPLQSEPVTGILTIAISDATPAEGAADGEGARTRIVWEYNVGGKMRYPIAGISSAVDSVMTLQLTRLAELLGPVELPSAGAAASENQGEGEGEPGSDAAQSNTGLDPQEATEIDPTQDDLPEAVQEPVEPEGPSVDDAFEDFGDGSD